jgi:hypothetical protein
LQLSIVPQYVIWTILEGLESSNKDVGKKEKAASSWVFFVKLPQHSSGNKLTKCRAGQIDRLMMRLKDLVV